MSRAKVIIWTNILIVFILNFFACLGPLIKYDFQTALKMISSWYSPFNLWNWGLEFLLLSPAIVLIGWIQYKNAVFHLGKSTVKKEIKAIGYFIVLIVGPILTLIWRIQKPLEKPFCESILGCIWNVFWVFLLWPFVLIHQIIRWLSGH